MTPKEYILANGKSGDVVGFSGRERLSDAINLLTAGIPRVSLSHVGLLCKTVSDTGGELLLFHSLYGSPHDCYLLKRRFDGMQSQRITDIIDDGAKVWGSVWHYPLYRALYAHESSRLLERLLVDLGKPYDKRGAARSAGLIFSAIQSLFRQEDLAELFCSEETVNALTDIGLFMTSNRSRWSPNRFTRRARAIGLLKPPIRIM